MTALPLFLALLAPAAIPDRAAPPDAAAKFAPFFLNDQFGDAHRVAGERGAVLVLIYGDRAAAGASRDLGAALHVRFHPAAAGKSAADAARAPVRPVPGRAAADSPPVRVVPAACAAGVPGPIRAAVAFQLRRAAPHTPIWLDWNGDLKARFGATPGVPNAVVVAPDGTARRVDAAAGGAAANIERVVEELRRAVAAGPAPNPQRQARTR